MNIKLEDQIAWTEREIIFMEEETTTYARTYEDDIPIVKAILQSLNNYRALLGNKNLEK